MLVKGLRIHYLEAGTGEPLLLLHGTAIDSAQLSYGVVIEQLAQSYHVIAPDWPGYGDSEYPLKVLDLEAYTELLAAFIVDLGLTDIHLAGFSMGGAIALNYAIKGHRLRSLTLISSYGLAKRLHLPLLPYLALRVPRLASSFWSGLRLNKRLIALVLRYIIFARAKNLTDNLVDEVYEQLKKPMVERAFMQWIRGEIGVLGLKSHYQNELHTLNLPTLLLHGARDIVIPAAFARNAARYLPNARLRIIKNCGHWLVREQSEAFVTNLRAFLDSI